MFTAIVLFVVDVKAQNVKPAFNHLTYVTYSTIISGKATNVELKSVIDIDANGRLKFVSKYYNGVADTAYQLDSKSIEKLNTIFNGKKKLNNYIAKTKMEEGMHFAGPYDYVSYTDKLGKKDELTIAVPLMATEFNYALDNLGKLPNKANTKIKSIKNVALSAAVLKSEKATKYLPPIESPPPSM